MEILDWLKNQKNAECQIAYDVLDIINSNLSNMELAIKYNVSDRTIRYAKLNRASPPINASPNEGK